MEKDLVSVIIPTYYRNKLLVRAIKSVVKQTYNNTEIIVIDDSINENAKKTVLKLNDQYPKIRIFYYNSMGKRQGAARNIGLKKSSGNYISILDDDDEWLPNKLSYEINILKDPNNFVVYGGRSIHLENGKEIENYIPKYGPYLSWHMIKLFNFVAFPALTFKKVVLEKVGYLDENLKTHEDWDFLNRLVLYYDFIPLKKIVAKIYKHDSNRDKEHFDQWECDKLEIFNRNKSNWSIVTYLLYFLRQTKLRILGRKY